MKLIADTIIKSNPRRDRILPIKGIKSIVIEGLVYFFGGTIDNNISKTIFHYDFNTKEVVKYKEVPSQKEISLLFKDTNLVAIDSDGDIYVLEGDEWTQNGNINISMPSCGVITENSQYIITDQKVYEFKDRAVELLKESETIRCEDYIPSTDKGIIHFRNSTLDLNNGFINHRVNQGDYIVYGEPQINHSDNDFVIDKINSYFVEFDSPITCIKIKTVSSKEWWVTDNIKDLTVRKFGIVNDIIPSDDKIFFSEIKNLNHTAYSISLNGKELSIENSVRRENYSYSKNIKYNHTVPKILKFDDSVAFMGNGGFYRDNGEYDNSLYLNNEVKIPLSLNIENPVYSSSNNTILTLDQPNSQLYQYTYGGVLLNTIEIPTVESVNSYNLYNNRLVLDTKNVTYIYDVIKKTMIDTIAHRTSIASAISNNFLFTVVDRSNDLQITKTSLLSNTAIKANTAFKNNYKKIDIYANGDNQLIMYVEENTNWVMYRIIFDE